jgi:sugar phosphate isomerase/epimerase
MKQSSSSLSPTRRDFLRNSTLAIAATTLLPNSPGASARAADTTPAPKKKIPIGLELYSVRGELSKDLPRTLQTVAKQGYEVVEFYSPYFAWKFPYAKEVRAMLDDLHLKCFSTHNGIGSMTPGETMDRAIELNQILGSHIIVLASPPRVTTGVEGWKKVCEQFTNAAQTFAPHGIAAGFHNHASEWTKVEGDLRAMDIIAANTPKEFVLQLDVGTCVEAGSDPVAWIKANPGRIRSVHLKDWTAGKREDEKGYRVLFGEGASPWKEIIAAAEADGGVEYYLMEQEGSRYPEFETAERCLASWRKLREQV